MSGSKVNAEIYPIAGILVLVSHPQSQVGWFRPVPMPRVLVLVLVK
jgi:hypothetical protein